MGIRILKHRYEANDLIYALEVCLDFHKDWEWMLLAEQPYPIMSFDRPIIWCLPRSHRALTFYSFCGEASLPPAECFLYDIVTRVKTPFSGFRFCDRWPVWSHDKSKLAFVELILDDDELHGTSRLLAVYDHRTGKHVRFDMQGIECIQWRDERSLRILRRLDLQNTYSVNRVDILSGNEETVQEIFLPGTPAHISFSPDGEFISYHSLGEDGDEMYFIIYVFNLREHIIAAKMEALDNSIPTWSPTGKYLAFAGDGQQGQSCMIIVDVPSFKRQYECVANHDSDPDISPTPNEPSWLSDDVIVMASLETVYPKTLTKLIVVDMVKGNEVPIAEIDGIVGKIVCPKPTFAR